MPTNITVIRTDDFIRLTPDGTVIIGRAHSRRHHGKHRHRPRAGGRDDYEHLSKAAHAAIRSSTVTTALVVVLLVGTPAVASAQLPFYTDDAEVTPKGQTHFESFNEYDWLPEDQAPHVRQNTVNMKFNVGIGHGLELDIDAPLITIVNDATIVPRVPFGVGDTNFGIKWQMREERKGSAAPAIASVFYIETPTGNASTGLGSGLVDTWVYVVAQKTLPHEWFLHLNGGYLFTGNTSTGVVGITTARGHVATMGGSLVKKGSDTLSLGLDITAAATNNADLGRTQLQTMFGGSYALRQDFSLALDVIVGQYAASPRVGVLLGFSWDLPK